jgi:ABC-type glycerol-3-phosphate transport system permease component
MTGMRIGAQVAVYVLVVLAVLIVAFPLLWMVAAALKAQSEIIDPNSSLWPTRSGLMIPFTVVIVPVVQLLANFGWIDSWTGLLVPTAYNLLMAGSLIAVVPVLIVAMIAQRKAVEGLTIGAIR